MIKKNKRFLNRIFTSIFNVLRTCFTSLCGLMISYMLIRHSPGLMDTYVYCMVAITLLINFSNFGGKDYLILHLVKTQHRLSQSVSELLKSRTVLSLAGACIILFLPLTFSLKCWLAVYLFIKTWQLVFDALTVTQKKFQLFSFIDLILYAGFILVLLAHRYELTYSLFLTALLILESIRLLASLIIYRSLINEHKATDTFAKTIRAAFPFFLLAITGFLSSKIDLYVTGAVLTKQELNNYYIILNLVSLSQVVYASFMSSFSTFIYRFQAAAFEKFSSLTVYLSSILSIFIGTGIYCICSF